jgi:hypothetical protein
LAAFRPGCTCASERLASGLAAEGAENVPQNRDCQRKPSIAFRRNGQKRYFAALIGWQ